MKTIDQLLKEIEEKVKPYYVKEDGNPFDDVHDFNHMKRVYGACEKMLEIEPKANRGEVLLAALLHDTGRSQGGEFDHAEFSYNIAKKLFKDYEQDFKDNTINLEKVLLMIKYHSVAHICPNKEIADSLEFNIFTDGDKIDMLGASGALRVPIAVAYKGRPTVYWAIKKLDILSRSDQFRFQSVAGRKIGQKYQDFLANFVREFNAQRQEFEIEK